MCFPAKHSGRAFVFFGVLLAAMALLILPGTSWGQAMVSGSIVGQVSDPSGAVIVGATVTLTDVATKTTTTTTSNSAGRFAFPSLKPGTYDVSITKSGFQKLLVPGVGVTLSQVTTLNETLKIGAASQTVEVTANATAQLQTMSATVGTTLSGDLMNLPAMGHDIGGLLNYQPTAAPTFHGTYGDITSGSVAGSTPDQNTFVLDGATNTSGLEGDSGYINGFSGEQRGVVPVPVESIQEVTVNTNNSTADFNTSSGAEMLAVTKRGNDTFHGAAFDFFQGSWLNANTWDNNRQALARPKSHENFFGFDVGGPMLPSLAGGKTYFYFDYEGLRNPDAIVGPHKRAVPGDLLRQGIIQIRTTQGVQSFNLNNTGSPLAVCGVTGTAQCDPRNTGMSSVVSTMWSQFMPEPNALNTSGTGIDELNTFAFRGNLTEPNNNDELIGRIDHDFGSKLRFMSRYSWYKDNAPTTNQLDIGGLLPGDAKGTFASASTNNNQPAQFVAGLEANVSSNVTNSFHFGYTLNGWNWIRKGNAPQIAGFPGPVEIDGESTNALIPINVDTQSARRRTWQEHNYDFRDELAWVKGNHFLTFGGDVLHEWWHFDRYDNVVGGLTTPIVEVDDASVDLSSANFLPQPCAGSAPGATATSNCIDANDPSEINTWNRFYADILGIVNHSSVVATRSGANLSLNPLGTPARSFVTVNTPSVYFTDTWRVKPSLTFNYGLSWSLQLPPHDLNGSQDVLVDSDNSPITYDNYVKNRIVAAQQGQIYAPVVGFSPAGAVGKGSKYAFRPFYGGFGPRVSLAWNPTFHSGFLSTLFGEKATVIRGGYSRLYGRDLGINIVSTPVLGYGFLQPDACIPSAPGSGLGTCVGVKAVDPTTAFRLGTNANADGTSVPFGALAPTLPTPVQPGIGANPGAELLDSMDQNFRPNNTDQADFTIQRQLRGNTLLEVGWVGVWGHNLFQGIDMNTVPWMLTLSGQSFANAWKNIYTQVAAGQPVTEQPFFAQAMGGSGSAFCAGNCAAALATTFGNNVSTDDVMDFFGNMETTPGYILPPALYTDTGQSTFFGPYVSTSSGFSNYQALIVKVTKHTTHGLTLNSNFTYGHALGTIGLAQTYTLDTPDNAYNLRADWTPQPWDRKFTYNALGTYVLPFGEGQRFLGNTNGFLSRLVSGWSVSPIFTFGSGLPAEVFTGSFLEMGAGFAENGASAVPLNPGRRYSNDPVTHGLSYCENGASCGNPNSVAVNSNIDLGGNGANIFGTHAIDVFNSFRPFVLGVDGAPSPDGNLRQPIVWQLDFAVTKDTRITERVHAQFFMQSQNFFNHNNWGGASLDLQDAPDFGTLSGGLTGPRIMQLGARVSF